MTKWPPRKHRPIVKVQSIGGGYLNVSPIMDAFEVLTGQDYREHIAAFHVVANAITAVVSPTAARTQWLEEAAAPWTRRNRNMLLNHVLEVIENFFGEEVSEDVLPSMLAYGDLAFRNLTPEQIRRAAKLMKPGKTTGATNHGFASVAAELALAVKAFGYQRKTGEDHAKARLRVANAMRTGAARHLKATQNGV